MLKAVSFDFYDTIFAIPKEARQFLNLQIISMVKEIAAIDEDDEKQLLNNFHYGQAWQELTLGGLSSFRGWAARAIEICNIHNVKSTKLAEEIGLLLERTWRRELQPLPNAVKTINKLKEKYMLAILSNAIGEPERRALERFGLLDKFDCIIFSSQLRARKPDLKLFIALSQELRLQPKEIAHVGDELEHDILPAKNIGMKTILIENAGTAASSILLQRADACINDLSELTKALRRLDG